MPAIEFDLIKEFGLENLPAEKKEALQTKIIELIDTRFNRLVLERLSEDDKQELDKVLASPDPEGMKTFIMTKVPNYMELYDQIVTDLKGEMLEMRDALLQA